MYFIFEAFQAQFWFLCVANLSRNPAPLHHIPSRAGANILPVYKLGNIIRKYSH